MKARTATGRDLDGHEAELHETPPEAVYALIKADPFLQQPRKIWEPSCGPGALVAALQANAHEVIASDLYQYEGRWRADPYTERLWNADFLCGHTHGLKRGVEAIVMNPPYSLADPFLITALALVPRVYALLELGWMQGGAMTGLRDDLLDGGRWLRCHPFRERIAGMHRDGWDGPRASTSRKHAWFVFGRPNGREEKAAARIGTPITQRISLEEFRHAS